MSSGADRRPWRLIGIVIAAIGVVPLAALAYLVESRATDSVRHEVRERLASNAGLTASFLDAQVRGIQEVVASYARRPRVLDALTRAGGPDIAELGRNMRELREARSDVLNIAGIADLAGTMLAGTVVQPPGADFSDRAWHRTVLSTRRPYVSEALVGRSPGSPLAVSIAVPVTSTGGELLAIIVVGYTLDKLQAFVDTFVAEHDTDVVVTDQAGVVIAQSGAPPTSLVSRADHPFVTRALAGESGVADDVRRAGGERVLAAYAPVPRLGWTVTAEVPRSDAYAAVAALRTRVLSITFALAALFVLGSVILTRAVRARAAAEREQRRISGQLAQVIDLSPVPTGITRVADGTILLANAAMLRALGWERDEMIGRSAADLDLWADSDHREAMVERLAREGRLREIGERLRRRDGSVFDAVTSIEVIEFDGERCLLGMFYDVTERVAAEDALRVYRSIFEHTRDGVLLSSPTGEVYSANPAACEILGMPAEEIRRRGRRGLADPTDERWHADGEGAASFHGERRMVRADGTPFVADISAVAFDDDRGRQWAAVMFRDVSERAAMIEERDRAAAEAEHATRLKSEFLATMSHEIRTPMNGVIGMTGLLLDTQLSAEQREYAETVRNSAETLLTILNDILDFSKIEAGRLELEDVDFDVALVAEEVAELLAAAAFDKGLELVVRIDPEVPDLCRADPGRVRQVLMNLVGNAVKFTETGTVELRVATTEARGAESVVRFEVQDTGIGIPSESQQRLFESFTQADAATTRRFGGTGLGLAISRRLVELMGGDIGVDSVPGEGSTFWFTVPVRRATAAAPSRPRTLVGLRALVIDDIAVNRTALSAKLAAWGITAVTVSSGDEALAVLDRAQRDGDRFDVVLSDFQMPVMDGLEVADVIARDLADPPPVIVLSSAGGRDSAQGRDSTSVARFLTKPARRSTLFDAIATVLGEAPSRRPERLPAADARPPGTAGRRVLVADDNQVNQRLATLLLQRNGYVVDAVDDGAAAVEAVKRGGYDAVLMDGEMPVMDGYTAAAEIRRHEAGRRRIPIVAVTASAMQGDVDRALAAGMDAHVAKPIDHDQLTRVLHELLDGRDPAPTRAPATPSPSPAGLDPAALGRLRQLDHDALTSLFDIFVHNGAALVDQLAAATRAGDPGAAAAAAHSLCGSASIFGARELAELAARIEQEGDAGHVPAPDLTARVERAYTRAVTALAQEIGSHLPT